MFWGLARPPQEGMTIVQDVIAAMKPYDIVATGFAIGRQIDDETIPVRKPS
ncbi:MAG: hypothetical protein P8P65_02130 [Planktotalea sp.]|uniref:hypothetical protein n=1 Tax=Planktotalea sp. TaxID=2029877 RepID=UPI002601D1C1|nr:hypothetical protein [Planktotalea sp.]MDG1075434.1 hypothetical protein [Planktotalea sp.]